MESESIKIRLLQEVFDIDWTQIDSSVGEDLARFTNGVVNDTKHVWYDDAPFINLLMDEFSDDHALWEYIILD